MKNTRTVQHKGLSTMVSVDLRRLFTRPLLYIILGSCFVMPILILVMTTMMDGTVHINPQTKEETVIEGFKNAWQIIGSYSDAPMAMDMTAMCNIGLLFFLTAVPVCLFVSEDFRSGFCKNLFTVRAKKGAYVASKTLVLWLTGALMLLCFFAGAILGGRISGLPMDLGRAGVTGLVMSMAAKILLMGVFVGVFLVFAVLAKEKAWLSMLLSFGCGTFLFMMIPLLTPLDAGIVHVIGCLAGATLFALGLGAVSTQILRKRDIL